MVVALTLRKEFLAEAILAKSTPLYAQKKEYKSYSFEEEIYPQARMQFKEYDKKYPTNEEFTKYFVRDLKNKDKELFETIGYKAAEEILVGKSAEEATLAQNQYYDAQIDQAKGTQGEEQLAGQTAGERAETMTGGGYAPPFPQSSTIYNIPRVSNLPDKLGGNEGGTGEGTAATNKAAKLALKEEIPTSQPSEPIPKTATRLQPPRIPSPIVNTAKNFSSAGQIFTKRASSRLASGFSNMLGNTARGGGSLLGSAIGAGGRAAGKLGVIGDRFFNQINRGKFGLKFPKVTVRRAAVIFFISSMGFAFLAGLLGGLIPGGSTTPPGASTPTPPAPTAKLTLTKSGPASASKDDEITYFITATLTGADKADVEISDEIPDNTTPVDEGGARKEGKAFKWGPINLTKGNSALVSFSIKANDDNIWITNTATATLSNATTTTPIASAQPPNTDSCGGKYSLRNPIGNFGDPSCNFTKDDLYNMLKQLDPAEADYWFNVVVRCETIPPYNPNSYADPSVVATPDRQGAWGLFQMGRGKGGQYDHGDVNWPLQTSNAINWNNLILRPLGKPWTYWECAKGRW